MVLPGKIVWEVMNSKDKLWVDIFKDLYIKDEDIFSPKYTSGSPTWNSTM